MTPTVTEEQKQQLQQVTLKSGVNAWDYVQSQSEEDRPILGDEGKSKEVSGVFAAILAGGYDTRDESQRTVQNHWLATVEQFDGGRKNAISNRLRGFLFLFVIVNTMKNWYFRILLYLCRRNRAE